MLDSIAGLIFFIIIAVVCCGLTGSPSNDTPPKRNVTSSRNTYSSRSASYSYGECPSCGAPYYDGYCDECGYPDVNQGWLGEEYG